MATFVRNLSEQVQQGFTFPDYDTKAVRAAHTFSNGNCAMVVFDKAAGNFYIYETSSADRSVGWTLKATLAIPSTLTMHRHVSALYSDNSIGLLYAVVGSDGTLGLNYTKFDAGTYAQTSGSVFSANSSYRWNDIGIDLDISEANVPHAVWAFGLNQSSGSVYLRTAVKRTNDGAWTQSGDYALYNAGASAQYSYGNISLVTTGITAAARRIVIAWDLILVQNNAAVDYGTRILYQVTNETDGLVNGPVQDSLNFAGYITDIAYQSRARWTRLFRNPSNVDEFICVIQHGYTGQNTPNNRNVMCYLKGLYSASGFSKPDPWVVQSYSATESVGSLVASVGFTLGIRGSVNVVCQSANQGGQNGVARFSAQQIMPQATSGPTTYHVSSDHWWDNATAASSTASGGGNKNANLNKHDMRLTYTRDVMHRCAIKPFAATGVEPANNATGVSATPTLKFTYQAPSTWNQTSLKLQFQFCTDPAFSTGVVDYVQQNLTSPNADRIGFLNTNTTDTAPKSLAEVLPSQYALSKNTWYMRYRTVDTLGNVGDWSSTNTLSVGHPPSASPIAPVNNKYIDYGTGAVTLSWSFSDTSQTDSQTAYQVRLRRDDNGAAVFDSGKITSTATSYTYTVPSTYKNITLYWEVRLWDTDDAAGPYSTGASYFQLVDPASVVVTSPTGVQVLTTGIPTFTGKVTTTGSRTVKEWLFAVTSNGQDVWTSRRFFGDLANNATMSVQMPDGVLKNNTAYTLQIRIVDDAQISNASPPVSFSTAWIAPLGPSNVTADITDYNTDGLGDVTVAWTDTNREATFAAWIVYRKADVMNPVTGQVDVPGTLEEVTRVYAINAGGYSINDYLAPSNVRVTYVVRQLVDRSGFKLTSENTTGAVCYPISDAYFLIDMLKAVPQALRLGIVTGDSYTDEQEEAEYNVIGRGRHVDKGEYLGPKGQLDIQIRLGRLMSPRAMRLRLLDLQQRNAELWLRNPFGDVWKVNTSSMTVGRIAGVGALEYCDVSIPYATVG